MRRCKVMKKRLAWVLLSLFIIQVATISTMAVSIDRSDLVLDNVKLEEKIICEATIEENFADDSIIVVLKKDANPEFKAVTQADFPEINAKNVKSLTEDIEPLVKATRNAQEKVIMVNQ